MVIDDVDDDEDDDDNDVDDDYDYLVSGNLLQPLGCFLFLFLFLYLIENCLVFPGFQHFVT